MQILNIAGYKFISLHDIETLRVQFLDQCTALHLKGTILLSKEGMNISLSGAEQTIKTFIDFLNNDKRFADIALHKTYSLTQSFKRLKVKLKNEIITLRKPEVNPVETRAPTISSETLKQWLDEKHDITLLDTRNDYEIHFGSFSGAINLGINDFTEFPFSLDKINRDKPIVMFCTGGVRCEKAALYLLQQGYENVYQLDRGILGYFAEVGSAHYEGECFVFDERVAVNTQLNPADTLQCQICQAPIEKEKQLLATFIPDVSCPACCIE